MRRLCAIAIVGAALAAAALTGSAQAASTYSYDAGLSQWIHLSLEQASVDAELGNGKKVPRPVYVKCFDNRAAFEQAFINRGHDPYQASHVIAYYPYGGGTINVRAGTCAAARQFVSGVYTATTIGAMTTLLHESLHRQGFHNEWETEQNAIASMYSTARLVQYNVYMGRGAVDTTAAWNATEATGVRVRRLAWSSRTGSWPMSTG